VGQGPVDQDALEDAGELVVHIATAAREQPVHLGGQGCFPVAVGTATPAAGGFLADFRGKVGELHGLARGHHGQPVAEVFQLAHVAGEVQPHQVLESAVGEALGLHAELLGALGQEVAG